MNRDQAAAGALASWTAAVLCRFCALAPDSKAPEDWRTPKPGGAAFGSWKVAFRFGACLETMNPPLTPPRRGTDGTRTNACSPPGRGWGWVGSWKARHPSSNFRAHSPAQHKSRLPTGRGEITPWNFASHLAVHVSNRPTERCRRALRD